MISSPQLRMLRSMELFSDCSASELKRIATFCDVVDFHPGDLLVRQGTVGREFFAVADGRLEVIKGDRVTDRLSGGPVGEVALLSNCRRTATVAARSRVKTLVFEPREFHWALNISPALSRTLHDTVLARTA